MAKKRSGLGKGVDSIDLREPHGLAPTVAPPPPPPPSSGPAKASAPAQAAAAAAAQWLDAESGISDTELPVVDVTDEEPPAPPEPKAAQATKSQPSRPQPRKLDVSLLPWVIKKQIAGETDREDLDFRVIFSVKGYTDCLVLEGHRNDFGRIYAAQPGNLDRQYLRWAKSGFVKHAADDALLLLKDQVDGILVESEGYSLELGSIEDLLDWCSY